MTHLLVVLTQQVLRQCWVVFTHCSHMLYPPKPHVVPEETGHCRQSGGRRLRLGPEGPAEGWDWMGLGLGSAGDGRHWD